MKVNQNQTPLSAFFVGGVSIIEVAPKMYEGEQKKNADGVPAYDVDVAVPHPNSALVTPSRVTFYSKALPEFKPNDRVIFPDLVASAYKDRQLFAASMHADAAASDLDAVLKGV